MTSDTDLPRQTDTFQQPLMKKKKNSSWKTFSILLSLVNLPFIGVILVNETIFVLQGSGLKYIVSNLIQTIISLSPFLLPLSIIDFIAAIYFIRKKSPPWIILLISLFALNVIFFLILKLTFKQSAGALAGFILVPLELILLLIDFVVTFSYIYRHFPNSKAKVIFYTALAFILLGLLALSGFSSVHL